MKRDSARRGFTLVEMLVVIAIIAVLVAVIVPTTASATKKSKAAADGANLRTVLGQADIMLLEKTPEEMITALSPTVPACKSFPGAQIMVVNNFPAFVDIYYVDGTDYYGLDYFSAVAYGKDPDTVPHSKPTGEGYADGNWVTLAHGD